MAQLPVYENNQPYNDWGDYFPEDDEGDVTDFTEGVDGYSVRGGYPGPPCYPATVGEAIQSGGKSYRVEHKLGHGSFSTTWLAFEIETNTSVALKIHRTFTTAGQTESRIHQDLQRLIPDPSHCHLIFSTSIFSLPGQFPDDTHVVVVLPVTGPDLKTFMDITDRNVMIGLIPGALDQGPTPSERYKQVGRPEKFSLPLCTFSTKTAFLGDFGLTRRIESPATDPCLPPETCCPPELLHEGSESTYKSDMWGFMCVFTTLMAGFNPFTGWSDSSTLGSMFEMLGPLPQEWEGRCEWPHHYPEEQRRKWHDHPRVPEDSLGDLLDRTREEDLGPRERELTLEVVHKGFRYQPSERISAQQPLDDESFWELVAIHGIE
ncbi:hypothetical protein INS49_014886 [Diaporthe citri]|uniref:uncharacterized protein n=1 Tax=Diaporthe citri TaxID=83186 RepID=UPI001C803BD1|nr:uncharacterized protein INS49_014886 [Diaporthe citri]KAG6357010.1 hypothetical protein INS49_014886 [Diaporthe citri]